MMSEATTMSFLLLFGCLLTVSPSESSCFLFRELVHTLASNTWRYMPRQRTTWSTENISFIHFISFHSIPFHVNQFFCMTLFIILECMLHILEPGFTVMRLYVRLQLKFQVISPNLMAAKCLQITV